MQATATDASLRINSNLARQLHFETVARCSAVMHRTFVSLASLRIKAHSVTNFDYVGMHLFVMLLHQTDERSKWQVLHPDLSSLFRQSMMRQMRMSHMICTSRDSAELHERLSVWEKNSRRHESRWLHYNTVPCLTQRKMAT
jgi:hypothetical protein